MSNDLKGEWKLLKVWECHKCKALIRFGRDITEHKCEFKESELLVEKKTIDEQNRIIDLQKRTIEDQKKVLEEKDRLVEKLKIDAEDKDIFIEKQKFDVEDRDKIIENRDNLIKEREKIIEEHKNIIEIQKKSIDSRDRTIEEQKRGIDNQKRIAETHRKTVESRDKVIADQSKIIEEQKKIIKDMTLKSNIIEDVEKDIEKDFLEEDFEKSLMVEKVIDINIPKINIGNNGEKVDVDIWKSGQSIKDSKNEGYRSDLEIEIYERGKEKKRLIIKNGKVVRKPDDIDLLGKNIPEGFIIKGIIVK